MKANVVEQSTPFSFCGRTYDLKLTFWAEAEIYERFGGGVESALRGRAVLKNLVKVLTILINEAVGQHNELHPDDLWEELDERYVGRHLSREDGDRMLRTVKTVFQLSRPEVTEELTDEEKNAVPSR